MSRTDAWPVAGRSTWKVACLAFFVWLVLGLSLVDDYGPTWDAAMGDLPYGERLVAYIETGDTAFLDNTKFVPVPARPDPHLDLDRERFASHQIYPLGALCCGTTSRIFTTWLGWLDPLSGFHIAVVLFAALTIAIVAAFGVRSGGVLVGLLGVLFLAGQPRWFGHTFNNPKDVPECALYFAASVAAFAACVRGGRARWMLVGALAGLALAQKANALFLPIQVAGIWFLVQRFGRAAPRPWRSLSIDLVAALLCAAVACVAVSPDVWSHPITGVLDRLSETMSVGRDQGEKSNAIDVHGVFVWFVSTPIALLVCAAVGCFSRRVPPHVRAFLALGVAIPLGRTLLPGYRNFDGVRHFLEFAPFLALLGALGAVAIAEYVGARLPRAARIGIAVAAVLPGLVTVMVVHPNQIVAFNTTIGGLRGAQQRLPTEAVDYWGNSYLQAIDWLTEHADRDSFVTAPMIPHIFAASAPVRLRPDIQVVDTLAPPSAGVLYIVSIAWRRDIGDFFERLEREANCVHRVLVQGGDVFQIYRVDIAASDVRWLDLLLESQVDANPLAIARRYCALHPEVAAALMMRFAAEPDVSLSALVESGEFAIPPAVVRALERLREILAAPAAPTAAER